MYTSIISTFNDSLTMQRGRFLVESRPMTKNSLRERFQLVTVPLTDTFPKLSVNIADIAKGKTDIPRQEELSSPICSKQFRTFERLGSGSFGTVQKLQFNDSDSVYAAKIIQIPMNEDTTHRSISQESEFQYKLAKNSDFFPKVIGIIFTNHSVTIVMEMVDNSLESLIPENGIHDMAFVKNCISQLLHGAKEMHEQKIAHMDIKPGNIGVSTIDGKDSFKYLDFSTTTARQLDENFMAIPHDYSLEYASPECLSSTSSEKQLPIRCDRSDSWSIGCTVLQILTGKLPWGLPMIPLMKKLWDFEQPEIPSSIPDGIKDFIIDCFKPTDERLSPAELLVKHCDMLSR